MFPPTLTAPVVVNGQIVDKTFTVLTLKAVAHDLCENGQCHPGQRDRLSRSDVTDIATLYKTTCGKNIIKPLNICKIICI